MSQNSISRLAIHIITDTKGMTAGFEQAQAETKKLATHTEAMSQRLKSASFNQVAFTKQLLASSAAFGRYTPVIGALGSQGGSLAMVAAGSLAAGAAVYKLADALGRMADAAADARVERMRDMFAEFGRPELAKGLETSAEGMRKFSNSYGEMAERIGLSSAEIKKSAINLAFMTSGLGMLARLVEMTPWGKEGKALQDAGKASEAFMRRQLEQGKALRADREARAKALQDEIRTIQSEMEASVSKLTSRGRSIADALRTPQEIFKDTIAELKQLADAGYITGEILSRGAAKAAQEFMNASEGARKLRHEYQGVPALEQGTHGFRTAVFSSQAAGRSDGDSKAEKEAAATLKVISKTLESINSKPGITFKKGSL